ncbi:competence/damage-inducible protein A [Clostridium taeniosporum]|uniref:Putative competence-damage inducible protein n=1 Tax=Clostridium taeniosporum TaxID=394958 RepID=A0A1D7XND6_9CLOT|nr:competence/damage-inducible protein A [Clostridium taeniosporum]AOR24700.1 competence/damage-inducible protein A [Clostridium taeniosporum]
MKVEIVSIGTEILLGDIVNTNSQYLSKELALLGLDVYNQQVVGDNEERIMEAFELAFSRSDIVITTGGLGPTDDDMTKEVASKYFDRELVEDKYSREKIEDYFKSMGKSMPKNNLKQALYPKDSIVVENNNGTAPGIIIEAKGKVMIIMPGPPNEIKPMFEENIKSYLGNKTNAVLYSKVVKIIGIGESSVAEKIKDIIDNQTNPTVAPYAKNGEVELRLTAKANDKAEGLRLIEPVLNDIRERLKENIYSISNETIEEVLGKTLINKNLTLASAESCTGGLIASTLISYPGISEVFMEGAVTYSNNAKIRRLGVRKDTLDSYGAVSEQVAIEMAKGICKTAGTDIGISTTGIAGPGGGTPEKPVGLVYIGICINGKAYAKRYLFKGNRSKVRKLTTICALDMIRREVENIS